MIWDIVKWNIMKSIHKSRNLGENTPSYLWILLVYAWSALLWRLGERTTFQLYGQICTNSRENCDISVSRDADWPNIILVGIRAGKQFVPSPLAQWMLGKAPGPSWRVITQWPLNPDPDHTACRTSIFDLIHVMSIRFLSGASNFDLNVLGSNPFCLPPASHWGADGSGALKF